MKVEYRFSLEYEIQSVQFYRERIEWYHKNNYKPTLPKNYNDISKEELTQIVINEFDESLFINYDFEKDSHFLTNLNKYATMLAEIFKTQVNDFFIQLTKYGMAGSYRLPNVVVLNINTKSIQPRLIVLHELTHLFIEPYIKKYNLKQFEKERIVDLTMNHKDLKFIKITHWQSTYNNTEKYVDDIFNKNFPNRIDNLFYEISKLSRDIVD